MWILTPCFLIPAIFSIIVAYKDEKSLKKEIELVKKLPQKDAITEIKLNDNEKTANIVRFAIVLLGVVCLFYGYFAGGTADVLTKAINICTECIGLG